jgi:Protein of unknown function (DUF3800)
MFIFYIDESGTGLSDQKFDYFVLASAAVHTDFCPEMYRHVSSLKRNIFPYLKPEDWEIRGRNIRQGDEAFKKKSWTERISIFESIATTLASPEYHLFAVLANKKQFSSESMGSNWKDEDLYRVTFSKLLDELNSFLIAQKTQGMLFLDSRSSHHSSIQDRRLIDVYSEWASRSESRFVELPIFGFSSFYPGLQLADVFSYLTSCVSNEKVKEKIDKTLMRPDETRKHDLQKAFDKLRERIVTLIEIP